MQLLCFILKLQIWIIHWKNGVGFAAIGLIAYTAVFPNYSGRLLTCPSTARVSRYSASRYRCQSSCPSLRSQFPKYVWWLHRSALSFHTCRCTSGTNRTACAPQSVPGWRCWRSRLLSPGTCSPRRCWSFQWLSAARPRPLVCSSGRWSRRRHRLSSGTRRPCPGWSAFRSAGCWSWPWCPPCACRACTSPASSTGPSPSSRTVGPLAWSWPGSAYPSLPTYCTRCPCSALRNCSKTPFSTSPSSGIWPPVSQHSSALPVLWATPTMHPVMWFKIL